MNQAPLKARGVRGREHTSNDGRNSVWKYIVYQRPKDCIGGKGEWRAGGYGSEGAHGKRE